MDKLDTITLPAPPGPSLPPKDTATTIISSNTMNRPLPSLPPTGNNSEGLQPESKPPLPARQGRRRKHVEHTPSHQKHSSTFGLDRVIGEEYETDSPTKAKSEVKQLDLLKEDPKPNYKNKLSRYLIDIREAQVAHAINKGIPSSYLLPTDTYLTEINSKDVYTDILCEINSSVFTNSNTLILYQLLLNSLSIVEELNVDSDNEISFDREALSEISEELKIDKDLNSVFQLITSITKIETINPLVVYIQEKYDSIRLSIVISILFDRFVVNNDHYLFLLIRTLENLSPIKLIKLYEKSNGDILGYLKKLFNSTEFWTNLIIHLQLKDLLDEFIHQSIVYGVESMVDTLIKFQFFPNNLNSIEINSNLIEFDKAYSFITNRESETALGNGGDELSKEKHKSIKLKKDLTIKSKKYNDLLNNYKQLNEEKYNDETILKKLKITNKELETSRGSYEEKINTLLANFQVIKINNDKNLEINSINDELKEEIEKLTKDVNSMKKKLKKK